MQEREENNLPQDKDPHLDIPAEANTDKHINFLDIEDNGDQNRVSNEKDEEAEERRKQWQQGLEEGRKAREGE